jgi:hypothetical protein
MDELMSETTHPLAKMSKAVAAWRRHFLFELAGRGRGRWW